METPSEWSRWLLAWVPRTGVSPAPTYATNTNADSKARRSDHEFTLRLRAYFQVGVRKLPRIIRLAKLPERVRKNPAVYEGTARERARMLLHAHPPTWERGSTSRGAAELIGKTVRVGLKP